MILDPTPLRKIKQMPNHCLNMQSVFGFNKDLVGGVHSLFDDSREAVIYPASHTLIYFDCTLQKQTFLQGHTNFISSIAVSNDKRWVASADSGDENSMIIIWDSVSLLPIRTYQLQQSVVRIDFSADASLLAVLTAQSPVQRLQIFEWASPSESPSVEAEVPVQFGFQRDLKFNPSDYRQLVTNSPFQTVFWEWKEFLLQNNQLSNVLQPQTPQISPSEFKTLPSAFTVSCFLPKTTAALTGTVNGEVVLYDRQGKNNQFHAIKLLQLHQSQQTSKPILPSAEISIKNDNIMLQPETDEYMIPGGRYFQLVKDREQNREQLIQQFYQYLTAASVCSQQMTSTATQSFSQAITVINAFQDGFVITGGLDGAVRMFDFRMRLLSWYENIEAGPITSISIVMPIQATIDNQLLSQAAVQLVPGATSDAVDKQSQNQLNQQFGSVVLRDFIIGTQRASIVLVPAAVFEFVEPERRRGQLLYQGLPGRVTATYTISKQETMPNQNNQINGQQFIATDRGDLIIFDYKSNQIIKSVNLLGQINASYTGNKLRGSLAQRHSEGFEQCCYLVPIDPRQRIQTMLYNYVTSIQYQERTRNMTRDLLVCGTNVGTCMLVDAGSLQLLSTFTHLTQLVTRRLPSYFKSEKRDISIQVPSPVKMVRVNAGDVIAVVDEGSQLCLLYKTKTETKKMDLITGRVEDSSQRDEYAGAGKHGETTAHTLLDPPRFVTEVETEEQENIDTKTVSDVRIHPAALLARSNQKRRDAAQTAGQWQNLGKVLISHAPVTDCQFVNQLPLYDEVRNEPRPITRDNLVLLAADRFLTIIDIQQSIDQIEADKIIVDRRFRIDQEQVPTAMCFLPRPEHYEPDLSQFNKADSLKDQINSAISSLQCETSGILNATMRPELQPVDQRDLLLISTDQYKIQCRQLQRFNQTIEISSRTILAPQQLVALNQQTSYFTGGYPTNYPNLLINVPGAPPAYIPGAGGYGLNTRLAGPLPLRKTILGPTFGEYIDQMIYIDRECSNKDLDSNQVSEEKYPYRTDYEVLNQAGSVRHKCQYIAFKTPQKIIGIMRTPLDGALNKYVGLIASAGELLQLDVCYVVKQGLDLGQTFLISAGKEDCCCFNFGLSYSNLDLMVDTAVQNDGLANSDPFLSQINQSNNFYQLIQEYFSYAQIYISEQRGVSPSEEPIAPVSMLPDILRALGIYLNNEQMQNAVAELSEEDIRKRRLRAALLLVKKSFNERRLPCPFDQREGSGNQLEFNKHPSIKPFMVDLEDFKSQEKYWEQDADFNYQFEQNLFEIVGNGEIMMTLQDLVRIIVNYRQLYSYDYELLVQAFDNIGAKDRQSFQENITKLGEKIEFAELQDMLNMINNQNVLPEILNVDEFAQQYLKLQQEEADVETNDGSGNADVQGGQYDEAYDDDETREL